MIEDKTLQAETDRRVDISDLGTALRNGRMLVIGLTAAFAIGGGVAAYVADPVYVADATIVLRSEKGTIARPFDEIGEGSMNRSLVETELDVITSRRLLGSLADRLDLISDPRYNAVLAEQRTPILTQVANAIGLSTAPPRVPSQGQQRENVINLLVGQINAKRQGDSLAMFITAESPDPDLSARLANTLAEIFLERRLTQRREDAELAISVTSRRVDETSVRISTLEQTLAEHIEVHRLDDPNYESELRAAITRIESRLNTIRPAPAAGSATDATAEMEAELENLRRELSSRTRAVVERTQIERQLLTETTRHQELVEMLAGLDTRMDVLRPGGKIVSPAEPPTRNSAMSPNTATVLGGAAGLLLSLLIVALRLSFDTRVRTAAHVERCLGVPCFASIPEVKGGVGWWRTKPHVHFANRPRSAFSETIRRFLFNLLVACGPGQGSTIVAVTSSVPDEGKTMSALCLAQAARSRFRRVAVIDLDLRRVGLLRALGVRSRRELEDHEHIWRVRWPADNRRSLKSFAMHHKSMPGVDLFPAAPTEGDVSLLLTDERLDEVFGYLREEYDFVVVDTPPVGIVSDIKLLSPYVDQVIIVVRWCKVAEQTLRDTANALVLSGIRIAGAILNRVEPKKISATNLRDRATSYRYYEYDE